MSKAVNSSIDERIVEMKFDNKQFESGVKETRKSLANLKEDLKFKDATNGIQEIQKSFNRMDFSAVTKGLENVKVQLSGIEVFTKRLIENLADSFYGAIQNLGNKLSMVFKQITEGGARRALNIEQAKFQLEGLGVAWEDIKGDIDYAVSGTAYGLDVAARAASQLVASNVDLGDEMKRALRGISGLAAMTNSSYEDIASIFTKVAGQGRMMGEDLNRIAARGINAAAELAKAFDTTEASIRDMVSKGEIDFQTFAKVMDDAFGEHAKDANETYEGSLSNVKAALSRIGADIKAAHFEDLRKIFVDLIPQLNAFKKAFKPVEDVIIKVEESLGALIQKIINAIDVKKLVDKIAPTIAKVGEKIVDAIDVVSLAIDRMNELAKDSPLAQMVRDMKRDADSVKKFGSSFAFATNKMGIFSLGVANSLNGTSDAIAEVDNDALKMSDDMANALQAAKDIWYKGTYGNGQQRIDALTAAGIDPKKTQAIIDEFIQNGYDWDAAVKKVGEDTGETIESNNEKAEKFRKTIMTLGTIFNNIRRTIKAVVTSIVNVISALVKAVTGSMEELGIGDIFISITAKIAELAEKFTITKEMAAKLTKPVKFLLDILKRAINVIGKVVSFVGRLIVSMAEVLYTVGKTISESKLFNDFLDKVSTSVGNLIESIRNFAKTAKESVELKKFGELIKNIGAVLLEFGGTVLAKVIDGLAWVIDKLQAFLGLVADVASGVFGGFVNIGHKVADYIGGILDAIGVGDLINDLKDAFSVFTTGNTAKDTEESIFAKISGFIQELLEVLWGDIQGLSVEKILVALKDVISVGAILETTMLLGRLNKLLGKIPKFMGSIEKMLKSTTKVNNSIAHLNNAKAFAEIAKVFLAFSASVALIMFATTKVADYINSGDGNAAAFQMAVDEVKKVMLVFAGAIAAMIAISKLIDLAMAAFTSKTKLHIPFLLQVAILIWSIGSAINNVVNALDVLGDMEQTKLELACDRLAKIGKGLGAFFAGLMLISALIDRFLGTGGGGEGVIKGMYAMAAVLVGLALSVDILMVAVSWMSMMIIGYGIDNVKKAVKLVDKMIATLFIGLAAVLATVALVAHVGADVDLTKGILAMAALFIAISIAMIGVVIAINDLTLSMKLFPEETVVAWAQVWILITSVIAAIAALVAQAGGVDEHGAEALGKVVKLVSALILLVGEIAFIADRIDSDIEMASLGMTLIGLMGIIASMADLMKAIGDKKPDEKAIAFLAITFAGLGAMITPLIFFTNMNDEWDATAIGLTMMGLIGVVDAMARLMATVGKKKPDPKAIAFLAIAFAGLGAMITPLMFFTRYNDGWDVLSVTSTMAGLVGVVLAMSKLMEAVGDKKPDPKAIAFLAIAFAGLGAMITPLMFFTRYNDGWDTLSVTATMAGLVGVVLAMSKVIEAIGNTKPDTKAIAALALAFSSLAVILLPIIAYEFNDWYDVSAIAAAMLGLVGVVLVMKEVIEAVGTVKPNPLAIAALAAAFAGVAVILVPLQMLEGEDWGAYLAALTGLAAVVGAFGFVMKAITSTTTPVQIIMVGAAMAAMSVGLAILGGALGLVSSKVNIEGLMGLVVALSSLTAVLTVLGVIVGKIPEAQMGILMITAALFSLALQTVAVTAAIGFLMDKFPNFTEDLKKFAYTIGELPSQIVKGFKEGFDINSPSKVFEEIGIYCIQGFLIGIRDTLVEGIKKIVTWLQDYIVTPICKFFGIASPSKLFSKLGGFLGQGLVNGFGETLEKEVDGSIILTGIKNKLNGEKFFSLGSLLGTETGNGILNGVSTALGGGDLSKALNLDSLKEGLNLDGLTEGFDINNLINTDSIGDMDFSNLGTAIKEEFRGVDYSDLFTWEDVVNSEALQEEIRNAGQSAFVEAAFEIEKHKRFAEKYPTFQDYLNDIETVAGPTIAQKYHEGNKEIQNSIEQGLIKNYIDLTKLSEDAYKYLKTGVDKAIDETIKKDDLIYGPNKLKQDVEIETNFITSKGEFLKNVETAFANSNGKIELNLNNSSLGNNLNAVSNDVSSSINALAGELANKLDNLNKGVSTLDSNQASQNNEIVSGLGYLATAMNGMKIVLDSGALVGQITPLMDASLGERGRRKARG